MNAINRPLIFIILMSIETAVVAEPLIVKYHQHAAEINKPVSQYYVKLLHLALTETIPDYGSFILSPQMFNSSQKRSLQILKSENIIDVHWTMTNPEREEELKAVYIPLLKGLMGYRVLLIKKTNRKKLTEINSIEKLKTISLGQGIGWPDTEILLANNLNVTLANAENLHKMLVKGRFDAFPRAVTEAWRELSYNESLTVDCCISLQYISPMYFFVKKENTLLAERLSKGLQRAIANGKFDALFFKYRAPKEMFDLVNFAERKVIRLRNPKLTEQTRNLLKQSHLWFFPDVIKN